MNTPNPPKESIVTFIKTFLLDSQWMIFSVIVKLFSSLAFNKMIALALGASGTTLFAHMMNLFNALLAIPHECTAKGMVSLLKKYPTKQGAYIGMGIVINLVSFLFFCGYLLLNHQNFFQLFALGNDSMLWGAVFLIATLGYLAHIFLLSFWQVQQAFQRYAMLNTVGNLLGLCLIAIASKTAPSYLLLVFPVGLGLSVVVTAIFSWRMLRAGFPRPIFQLNSKVFQDWLNFFFMAVSLLLFDRVVSFAVREYSIAYFNSENTGYWQAVATLSSYYTAAYFSIVMVAFYPKIVTLVNEQGAVGKYLRQMLGLLSILLIAGLSIVYFSRYWLTDALFSEGYAQTYELYRFQLIGDVFRLLGFLMAYLLLAQHRITAFVIAQAITAISYIGAVPLLVDHWGLETFPLAHLVKSIIGFLVLAFLTRRTLIGR